MAAHIAKPVDVRKMLATLRSVLDEALHIGVDSFLSKPVEPEHLYQTLEELIWKAEQ